MEQDDITLLQEVQKNSQLAMTAIDALLDKTNDNDFTIRLSKQSIGYAKIHNSAVERLIDNESSTYRGNQIDDVMLRGSIHAGTLFDISTGHLAELMIRESNRGLTNMWRAIKHSQTAKDASVEIAMELVDFEQENIERLKEYL